MTQYYTKGFSIMCVLLISMSALTAQNTWKTLKTGSGGWITGMDIHPSGAPILAKSDVGGAYVYDDQSAEWIQVVTDSSMPAADVYWNRFEGVTSIVSSPSNNQIWYMAFVDKIYKSSDYGASWQATGYVALGYTEAIVGSDTLSAEKELLPNSDDTKLYGERLSVDPANEDLVYFGSSITGLRYSEDGGNTWGTHSDTSAANFVPLGVFRSGIRKIIFDSSYGTSNGKTNRIYALVDGEDVYMSLDAGVTWQALNIPESIPFFHDAEVHNGVLYVSGRNEDDLYGGFGLWSYNGSWTQKYNNFYDYEDWMQLAIDPFNPDRAFLFAVLSSEIRRTENLTDSNPIWESLTNERLSPNIPWMSFTETNAYTLGKVLFDPAVSDKLWIGMGAGVYFSTDLDDNLMTWVEESSGQEHLVSSDVLSFPDNTALSSHWDFGIFKHEDFDSYPSEHKPSARFSSAWDMDQSPQDPEYVVAIIEDGRFCCIDDSSRNSGYSEDGGRTWTKFASQIDDAIETNFVKNKKYGQIAVSALDKDNLIWQPAVYGELPWYTLDRGTSWTQCVLPSPSYVVGIRAEYFETLPLTADRVLAQTFYLYDQGPNGNIFKTTDGGQNWTKNSFSLNVSETYNAKLESIHGKAGHLLWSRGPEQAVALMSGLWHSSDGGESFQEIPGTDEVLNFSSGKSFPGQSYPAVYFQGKYNGVLGYYASIDSMQTWVNIGNNPTGKFEYANVIEADKFQAGRIFVGFTGHGFIYHEVDSLDQTVNVLVDEDSIEIMPNPNNGVFTIAGLLSNYSIEILDLNGVLYQALTEVFSTTDIDISALPNGLYFIKVTNSLNSNIRIEKILKQ